MQQDIQSLVALNIVGAKEEALINQILTRLMEKSEKNFDDVSREEAFFIDRIIADEPDSEMIQKIRAAVAKKINE